MIVRALSTLAIVWLLGFAAFMLSLGRPLDDVTTDAIVVPTGSAGRIDRGIKLIQAGAAKRMLVTGVARDVRPQELAAQYDAPRRLFDCCIDLGFEAVDTRSNANETAAWVNSRGVRSVRLVTSDWHMARAGLELRNSLGDDVEVVGDAVPESPRLGFLFLEYNKYLIRLVAITFGIGQ
ncbi:YdcF family protein [Sphingomonas sp. AX6]|uniref:YdcF family protein n=1 Tax=Sphingomonas sp. AX6 TaxID=2653171 RepID=UPI0012F0F4DD|nr:YdcF family protein [Sphingomonas sp. AX6]VXC54498.1 conserved hypothetical protein [Sphingomonas sp. AX6]